MSDQNVQPHNHIEALLSVGEALANNPKYDAPPVFAHVIQMAVYEMRALEKKVSELEAAIDEGPSNPWRFWRDKAATLAEGMANTKAQNNTILVNDDGGKPALIYDNDQGKTSPNGAWLEEARRVFWKPADIPEDVWTEADNCITYSEWPNATANDVEMVARAILAERKRFSPVIEALKKATRSVDPLQCNPWLGDALEAIAKAEGRE